MNIKSFPTAQQRRKAKCFMVTGADQKNVSSGNLPVEDSQQLILAEAMKIVRGKTMMLATEAHLKALAELNKELLEALKDAESLVIGWAVHHAINGCVTPEQFAKAADISGWNPVHRGIYEKVKAVIAKAEAVQA